MRQNRRTLSLWVAALATLMFVSVVMAAFCDDADARSRRRRRGPDREGFFIRFAVAFTGACAGGTEVCQEPDPGFQFTPDLALGGRFGTLGFEGRTFFNPYADGDDLGLAFSMLFSFKLFPLQEGRLDPYVSVGLGYLGLHRLEDGPETNPSAFGLAGQVGAGLDVYITDDFSMGLGTDYLLMTPASGVTGGGISEDAFWTGRLNFTFYPDGSKRTKVRKKKKRRRRRPRPRPKKKKKKEEFF